MKHDNDNAIYLYSALQFNAQCPDSKIVTGRGRVISGGAAGYTNREPLLFHLRHPLYNAAAFAGRRESVCPTFNRSSTEDGPMVAQRGT